MDKCEKKHIAAVKKMLRADNDKAFDISGRRNAKLLGMACGLLCAPAARLIYSAFDKACRILFSDSTADAALVELAIVVIAVLFGLSLAMKYIRFRNAGEYEDYCLDDYGFYCVFDDEKPKEDDELPFM